MNQLLCVQKQKYPQLHYELREEQRTVVEMVIDFDHNTPTARCTTTTEQFRINFDGFWRHQVLVKNMRDALVALLYAESWFSETSLLRIGDKLLRTKFHNNPLTELILFEDESKPLIRCRLTSIGMTTVELAEDIALHHLKEREALLGLVWFLFFPIAQENTIEFAW